MGSELVINGAGPRGSLRRAAAAAGCPTIILEADEVWRVEPSVVESGVQGIRNVLIALGMVAGEAVRPRYQAVVRKTTWVRAMMGGFLDFHIAPGAVVTAGQSLATNTSLLGQQHNVLTAPVAGVVIGMTTLPAVAPGDPVCHLAKPAHGVGSILKALARSTDEAMLHDRLRVDLASYNTVSEAPPSATAP